MIKISVVIPVFNEEKRLPKTFSALNALSRDPFFSGAEIIFVDDGSMDGTKKLIENFRSDINVKLVSCEKNRGKGFAVRRGMMEAIHKIFPYARIDRWSYDAEILYLARLCNLKIHEVPVLWTNDEDSRVRLGKDALQSFTDLLKIRLNKYSGNKTA